MYEVLSNYSCLCGSKHLEDYEVLPKSVMVNT